MTTHKTVNIVGAGIFGLSLAVSLRSKGYKVTIFDQCSYDENDYDPGKLSGKNVASVDYNKILRSSYGTKIHYQRLALESREAWLKMNQQHDSELFVGCGMLRVQPSPELGLLEQETLANMERDALRDTQFVKSDEADRERATELGWDAKLLEFCIPGDVDERFEAVLDSLAGYVDSSKACASMKKLAASDGVDFCLGPNEGCFDSMVFQEDQPANSGSAVRKAVGIKTRDGVFHKSDVVVIAAGSYSTQLLPDLSYHLESSAGCVVTFKIDKGNSDLWEKYGPANFPVLTWKSMPRDQKGKDTGSVYVFPRTSQGIVKIGYRGIKFTNFVPAPEGAPFTQDGQWSVPLPPGQPDSLPQPAVNAIRRFVAIFLPEFSDVPFHSTKLCWYTDSLDNSFVIDYVPTYADRSVFVCTGGSGHGAKFLPVIGEHAADIFENGAESTSFMYPHWRWREDKARGNGLEEGPSGPRNIGCHQA